MLFSLCFIMLGATTAGMVDVATNTQVHLFNAGFLSYSEILVSFLIVNYFKGNRWSSS
jgi:thiosulfate reductase cytochrome b subunit